MIISEIISLTNLENTNIDLESLKKYLEKDKEKENYFSEPKIYSGCLSSEVLNINDISFVVKDIKLDKNTILGVVEFDSNNPKSVLIYNLHKKDLGSFKMIFKGTSEDDIIYITEILHWEFSQVTSLSYEEGNEGIKPKSKFLDPIKNNSFGDRDFTEEKVSFKSVESNELNEDRISNSVEYKKITEFLIKYEKENFILLGKNNKIKKTEIVSIWNVLKKVFKNHSYFIMFDIITNYYNYDGTKFYSYLNPIDKQILWEELKERIE